MSAKYILGILLFSAGLVSGMLAQRAITPAPELSAPVSAPTPQLASASLKQPEIARDSHEDSVVWQEEVDLTEPQFEHSSESSHQSFTVSEQSERSEWRGRPNRETWTNREAAFEAAWSNREAWIAYRRAEQVARQATIRSNFVKQADLSEDQAVRFDVLMSAMNLRLQQQAQIWQKAIEDGTMTRPEIRARAMKEVGTALALTYDELDRSMPADWRTTTSNETMNLWTFIDPDVMRAMRPAMSGRVPGIPRGGMGGGGMGAGSGHMH